MINDTSAWTPNSSSPNSGICVPPTLIHGMCVCIRACVPSPPAHCTPKQPQTEQIAQPLRLGTVGHPRAMDAFALRHSIATERAPLTLDPGATDAIALRNSTATEHADKESDRQSRPNRTNDQTEIV